MLHTINKSPFSHVTLSDCLRVCDSTCSVLLLEDGVYAALADSVWQQRLSASVHRVYALKADVQARGLEGRLSEAVIVVDYTGFVQLCCEHTPIQSWF